MHLYLRSDVVVFFFFHCLFSYIFIKKKNRYSETCLNRTPLGPTFGFGIDRCSVNRPDFTRTTKKAEIDNRKY